MSSNQENSDQQNANEEKSNENNLKQENSIKENFYQDHYHEEYFDKEKTPIRHVLYYFNVTGLAEPIRYLLSYCGIPFRDRRLDYETEWLPKYKAGMPMEQVPVLEIDGVRYHQHMAICRYIAKTNGLNGSNAEEACQMEALVEDINDIRLEVGNWYKEDDTLMKNKLKERVLNKLPFYLKRFESLVEKNHPHEVFIGKQISWVDIYYAAIMEMMSNLLKDDVQKDYPILKNLCKRIRSHMLISPYINKRPRDTYI